MENEFEERGMDKQHRILALVGGYPQHVNSRGNVDNNPFIRNTFRIFTIILLVTILILNVTYITAHSAINSENYTAPLEQCAQKTSNATSNHHLEGTVDVQSDRSCKISNKTYHFFTDKGLNWARALHFCITHGFELADIPTKDHDDAIKNFILRKGLMYPFWVAGLGFGDGQFYWIKNGRMIGESYNGWGNGQPDFKDTERCLEINFNSGWNNRHCDHTKHVDPKVNQNLGVLCQKEIN